MRAVVQRVTGGAGVGGASVCSGGRVVSQIGHGLLVYLGVGIEDTEADADYLADKVRHLRVFPEGDKHLNRDVLDVGGQVLVVSAFTVQADARKGRRPSLDQAAPPERARELYEYFCDVLAGLGVPVERGVFRAEMAVASVNDGPVCILLDSHKGF